MKPSRYVIVEKACCGTCAHYHQHYVLGKGGKVSPLWYGHCHAPRMKRRTPEETCALWAPSDRAEDGA